MNTKSAKSAGKKRWLNYPRAGVTGWKRWLPTFKQVAAGVLGCVVAVIALFCVGYALTGIPAPNASAAGQTSTVYYDDGKTPIGTFKVENRTNVSIDKISPNMQHAAVAAEDKTFYENRGVSIKGLSRAVWGVVTNDYSGGGSTITQQFVKNYYLTNEHSIGRKVKEMFISLKIDQEQSKDEVMANYLNTVFLGRRSYGIEVASQAYFNKPASELTVAQSALMAAMIQQPSLADPHENPEKYEQRFHYVLDGMAELGYISQDEAKSTKMPTVLAVKKENQYTGQTGYLMDSVRSELKKSGKMTDEQIDRGGLSITTTFNKKMISDAVKSVNKLPTLKKGMHVALTSVDPATGGIKAMYGGPDYFERQQNQSTQDTMQAGSTFKPFALVAALENGYRLNDTFTGSPTTFKNDGSPWTPENFGGASYGRVTLLKATENSINTAYAQLNMNVGPDKTMDAAIRAGMPKSTRDLQGNPANVLGTASPHNLDMASAYATFAAEGIYRAPHTVQEAKSADGKSLYKPDTEGKRHFDKAVMAETSYALRHVVTSGSGSTAQNLGRPAAGKTGTSSSNYSAWFDGYTPQLSTAVSMYRESANGKQMKMGSFGGRGEVTGASFPVQVWTDYMEQALEGQPVEKFPKRGELPDVEKPGDKSGAGQGRADTENGDIPRKTREAARPQETAKPSEEPKATESPKDEESQEPEAPKTQAPKPKPKPTKESGGGSDSDPGSHSGDDKEPGNSDSKNDSNKNGADSSEDGNKSG